MTAQEDVTVVPLRTWVAVMGAMLGAFMAVLDIQITNASLANITSGVGATLDEGSWISISYLVPEIIVIPLCGWLASVFGLRRYLVWNSLLFLVFSVLCGSAWSLESLIVFRAVQGFTGGAFIPMASTMTLSMLPPAKQPLGFALFAMTAMFAPAIGPTIGGWITDTYSWPWVFYLNLVPGAAFFAAIAWGLDPSPKRLSLIKTGDWTGIGLMAVGLGSLTVFLEEGTRKDWFASPMIVRLAIAAAISLPAFIALQLLRRKTDPLLNLQLFAQRNFAIGSAINFVLGLCLYSMMYLLPLYLAQVQTYSALQIGETMVWVGLPQLVIMPFVPRLMRVFDRRVLIAAGFAAFAASGLLMSHLSADFGQEQLMLPQIIRALGLPVIMVPLLVLTTSGIDSANAASASGIFNMLRNLGGSVGIALSSALFTRREQFHSHHLGEMISLYNPLTRERLDSMSRAFEASGLDVATAQERAVGALDLIVRKQACLLAYSDAFFSLTLLVLAMIPLVFFCRKSTGEDAGLSH
jgi:DHA2 family multidrug resistance protein